MLDTDTFVVLDHEEMSYQLIRYFRKNGILTDADRVIITSGSARMIERGTNLLEIYAVGEIIRNETPRLKRWGF